MPKTPIDYSKSVIYKIEHMDKPELVYVGSTTDFTKRKYQHKTICINKKSKRYNQKIYQIIRDNEGFESFKMMILCEFPCNSKTELLIEEEKYRKELQATLNSNHAYSSIEETKEKEKQYREKNKEQIKERMKEYRENKKEQITNQKKKYYENNKEHQKKYQETNKEKIMNIKKKYYETHKQIINEKVYEYNELNKEKLKEKITCECGSMFLRRAKLRHERTIRHCQFIQQN